MHNCAPAMLDHLPCHVWLRLCATELLQQAMMAALQQQQMSCRLSHMKRCGTSAFTSLAALKLWTQSITGCYEKPLRLLRASMRHSCCLGAPCNCCLPLTRLQNVIREGPRSVHAVPGCVVVPCCQVVTCTAAILLVTGCVLPCWAQVGPSAVLIACYSKML